MLEMASPFDSLLPWLDLAGLSVFAASGALAAARKRLDFVATLLECSHEDLRVFHTVGA